MPSNESSPFIRSDCLVNRRIGDLLLPAPGTAYNKNGAERARRSEKRERRYAIKARPGAVKCAPYGDETRAPDEPSDEPGHVGREIALSAAVEELAAAPTGYRSPGEIAREGDPLAPLPGIRNVPPD